MNNVVRQKLVEILARHGQEIIYAPRRCEGLLRDYVPAQRREISVLVNALEERVPVDLLATSSSAVPRSVLFTRLAKRLHDDVAMEESAARWAVGTWALALGRITADELAELDRQGAQTSTPATQRATIPATTGSADATHRPATPRVTSTQTAANVKARDIVVSAAGDGDFPSISEAIRRAPPGARVLVRPGLYRDSIVIDREVEILGDGTSETIIVESVGASCLTMRSAALASARNLTLRGASPLSGHTGFFTIDIAQGALTLEDCDITSNALACIALHEAAATSLIRRCYIHHGADSGIYAFNGAQGRVEDCLIEAHRNVCIAVMGQARLALVGSRIQNGEDAGVVAWNEGNATLEDCEISGHRKTNVGVSETGQISARGCRLHGGENSGIFVHQSGRAAFEDCEIFSHVEAQAAVTSGGHLVLRDCSVHHGQHSAVFVRERGRALVENCDLYANLEAGVEIQAGGVATIRGSRINGNGTVAVEVAPGGAVDAENNDFTGNRIAAWETNYDTLVESRGNKL
jgi:Right handed beta helix region/Pectinesterase